MHFWSFDAKCLCLTVDAFTARSLVVNGLVDGMRTVKSHTHLSPFFPVDILDAPFLFDELLVLTGSTCFLWEKQRATEALGPIAIGMIELDGWMHTQTHRAQRCSIGVTLILGMSMLIERHRSDPPMTSGIIID